MKNKKLQKYIENAELENIVLELNNYPEFKNEQKIIQLAIDRRDKLIKEGLKYTSEITTFYKIKGCLIYIIENL